MARNSTLRRAKGMKGAIERALELVEQALMAWMPQQFENSANIDVHVRTTAQEIVSGFRDAPIDVIIGVGTGQAHHHRGRDVEEGMA